MEGQTPAQRNQRAIVKIDPHEIQHLLDLPEGIYVAAVHADHDPYGISVVVEGPALEPQPLDACLPALGGVFSRETRYINGQTWARWGWMR